MSKKEGKVSEPFISAQLNEETVRRLSLLRTTGEDVSRGCKVRFPVVKCKLEEVWVVEVKTLSPLAVI